MNDLLKEASKQTILEAISFLWLGGRGKGRKSRREPYKPLTGHPRDYLTGLEPNCEVLQINFYECPPFKHQGVDLDRFKRECEEIDNNN